MTRGAFRVAHEEAAQLLSADILRDAALAHPLVLVGDFNSLSHRGAVPPAPRPIEAAGVTTTTGDARPVG